ncbi:MAG: cyclic peptide export ABC transporter [Candidatus Omnitrophica bacterium]|nr:cyclic peptide export ABC transporter [Candidatus Omnitrophota bacterium]MCB9721407.1 cyclic peptide export ABC transporter [Candidatus Omnitrophota bacterium]
MNLLKFLWNNSRKLVVVAIVTSIVCGLATAGLVACIHAALKNAASVPGRIAWGFTGLCALSLLSGIVAQVILVHISQGAIYDLRMRLSRQILSTRLRDLERIGPHKLLSSLTDDIMALSYGLLAVPIISVQVMIAVGCLVYLGYISLPLLGVIIGFLAAAMVSYWIPSSVAIKRLEKAREQQDFMFKHFRALTEGAKELKINSGRRHAFFHDVFHPTAETYRRQNVIGFSIYAAAANWGYLSFFLMIGVVIFVLPAFLKMDADLLTGATLILLYLRSPLELIFSMVPELARSQIALKKVEKLGIDLSAPDDRTLDKDAHTDTASGHRLELRGVSYSFDHEESHHFQLGPLNALFRQGETVMIIGGNGSGKSTLVKLLTGLYAPDGGEVLWDGCAVNDTNRDDFRQNFAAVFSDFFLFETLLGMPVEGLDARAKEHLRRLQLEHKVRIEGGRFSTLNLSQGQRKRLALLTAFLEDRPFYVFDEWAADQDPYFKGIFYTQILPALKEKGKGVICITHDEKYFHLSDRLIKLDCGKIEDVREAVDIRFNEEGVMIHDTRKSVSS